MLTNKRRRQLGAIVRCSAALRRHRLAREHSLRQFTRILPSAVNYTELQALINRHEQLVRAAELHLRPALAVLN